MKTSQEIAIIIKETAKSKKIAVGKMLSDCNLSINTLSSMQSGGFFPRLEAINKIADYLNCSVDYLLGRTDNPDVIPINMNGNQQRNTYGNNSISLFAMSESKSEMEAIFNELSPRERTELMMMIYQFYDEHKKKSQPQIQQRTYPVRTAARGGQAVVTEQMTWEEIEEMESYKDADEDL